MSIIVKETIIDEYFKYQKEYEEKFGEKTVVLVEVGSFYEVYEVENENEKIGKAKEISQITNFQLTKKNKNIEGNDRKNPLLVGINTITLDKNIQRIIENGYTVVKVSQISPAPNPKRAVTEILSSSTVIDIDNLPQDNNFIIGIYLTKLKNIYCAGYSKIDISTGECEVEEINGNQYDERLALDSLINLFTSTKAKEIVIFSDLKKNEIYKEYDFNSTVHFFTNYKENNEYLNNFLNEVYKFKNFLSPIENLNLERHYFSTVSFVNTLKFIAEHNINYLEKIQKPKIIDSKDFLYLNTNTIEQLNIINHNGLIKTKDKIRFHSVFDVIDKTKTIIGKRKLKKMLLNPITDVEILTERYNNIEKTKSIYKEVDKYLETISDMERLHRRIGLNILNPYELNNLYESYKACIKIFDIENEVLKFSKKNDLIELVKNIESNINLDIIKKYNINDIKDNFLLNPSNELMMELKNLQEIEDVLNNIKIEFKKIDDSIDFEIKEKIYFYLSNNKFKNLNKNLIINFEYLNKKHEIKILDLEIQKLSNQTKFKFEILDEIGDKYILQSLRVYKLVKEEYLKFLEDIYDEDLFLSLVEFISLIDVYSSQAKVSIFYNYCKPEIETSKPFIFSKDLRHPIVEQLNDYKYIGNDVILNTENKGLLIYGLNASGKSTYQKSIGVAIILAQSGFYVPAQEFKFYPYNKLFTRLQNGDNIFKGQSEFTVEMVELKGILQRADENSLVLGDEICQGTENISGQAIVSASILTLQELKSNFVFATHIFELSEDKEIKNIKEIKHYHLTFEKNGDKIIYHRKLIEGSGKGLYGLEFVRTLNMRDSFINKAERKRKEILGSSNLEFLVDDKKNKYNNKKNQTRCLICNKKNEETHHIIEQNKFNKKEKFKNHKSNLINLCKDCHEKVHKKEIEILGFKQTTQGLFLEYKKNI